MNESRLKIFPNIDIKVEDLNTTLPDSKVIKAKLEYVEQDIQLGSYNYHIFVGSTAGRKGFPNQDFAGLAQKDLLIKNEKWSCLLAMVADGVSSRKGSEDTSKSIVENALDGFSKTNKNYNSLDSATEDLWHWIAEGAQGSPSLTGVSTVSAFLLTVFNNETIGVAINCGDSRIYWATPTYVNSAKVHSSPTGSITFSLGADRQNENVHKDIYVIKDFIPEVFLCTDTFAFRHDGVHFPKEMIPSFGKGIAFLNDHLTAISIRKKT